MRIIKLSPTDDEMHTREDVLAFFQQKLRDPERDGKFGLSPAKGRMAGIRAGTLLLFTYQTECMFLARAATGIIHDDDPEYPAYFQVDPSSIERVGSSLQHFEDALKKAKLRDKNLVKSRAWPQLPPRAEAFALDYFSAWRHRRVLFVRLGWMWRYHGSLPGDERPIGGGGYNKDEIGHELYNFYPVQSKLYGYFQPHMAADRTALERIESHATAKDFLTNVTVVFVAKRPGGTQVIIGWYHHATLYRELGPTVPSRPQSHSVYRCVAKVRDAVLLPDKERQFQIPRHKGGFGQTNVCYPLDTGGNQKVQTWITEALSYVAGYQGENLLTNPTADANDDMAADFEAALRGGTGQGFRVNAEDRKALEEYGMEQAEAYFRKKGYAVEDVSRTESFDFLCRKGTSELRIEVKATTTDGNTILLPPNEANLAARNDGKSVLFVLHSIRLENGRASGGRQRVLWPWRFSWDNAKPTGYVYQLPPENRTTPRFVRPYV